jgi:hypothetical protein
LWTHDRFREFVRELQCGERRAQTLPVIREWLATAGLFQAAGDPLSGCTP